MAYDMAKTSRNDSSRCLKPWSISKGIQATAEFFFFLTDFCKFAELDVLVIGWDLVERIRPQDLIQHELRMFRSDRVQRYRFLQVILGRDAVA